jgi:hypothetical protein
MSIAPGNSNFTKLFDSGLESNVFEALVSSGVLPQGFQVIVGNVNLEGVASGDESPVLDSNSEQIVLRNNATVLLSAYVNRGATMTATSEVAIGLAAASGANQAIATSLIAADDAESNQSVAPTYVGSTNKFLTAGVSVATNSAASVLQVILIVV